MQITKNAANSPPRKNNKHKPDHGIPFNRIDHGRWQHLNNQRLFIPLPSCFCFIHNKDDSPINRLVAVFISDGSSSGDDGSSGDDSGDDGGGSDEYDYWGKWCLSLGICLYINNYSKLTYFSSVTCSRKKGVSVLTKTTTTNQQHTPRLIDFVVACMEKYFVWFLGQPAGRFNPLIAAVGWLFGAAGESVSLFAQTGSTGESVSLPRDFCLDGTDLAALGAVGGGGGGGGACIINLSNSVGVGWLSITKWTSST
jgi:hypothetical protein